MLFRSDIFTAALLDLWAEVLDLWVAVVDPWVAVLDPCWSSGRRTAVLDWRPEQRDEENGGAGLETEAAGFFCSSWPWPLPELPARRRSMSGCALALARLPLVPLLRLTVWRRRCAWLRKKEACV